VPFVQSETGDHVSQYLIQNHALGVNSQAGHQFSHIQECLCHWKASIWIFHRVLCQFGSILVHDLSIPLINLQYSAVYSDHPVGQFDKLKGTTDPLGIEFKDEIVVCSDVMVVFWVEIEDSSVLILLIKSL